MKIVAWILFAYCVINIENVKAGGKSMVIFIKDGSSSNDLVSVEVDQEFYSTILKQISLKNKKTSAVKNMDSSKDFLEMVSGGKCKCQCLCCDEPSITTPPPLRTTPILPTTRPPRTTTPPPKTTTPPPKTTTPPPKTTTPLIRTTTPPPRTTTPPPRTTTPPPLTTTSLLPTTRPPRTTTPPPKTTTALIRTTTPPPPTTPRKGITSTVQPTTPFEGPTYLPPSKVSTPPRPTTTSRKYGTFVNTSAKKMTVRIGTWYPPSRRSTTSRPVITTTPKYAYYAPENRFYYPGEGLQLVKGGKPYYAVEPISNQKIIPPQAPKNKWNFLNL